MGKVETIKSRSLAKAPQQKSAAKAAAPFFNPVIQPKLTINQPNDVYEQEADAAADKVMRMTDHEALHTKPAPVSVQMKCVNCGAEEKLQLKEQDENEEELVQLSPVAAIAVQRKCAECEAEEKLMRKCAGCEEEVHRKESGVGIAPAPTPAVYQTIQSAGHPLDAGIRSFMESRFSEDFSGVQIHNDGLAHRSAKEINARAYTHGNHIVFGLGEYQPHTQSGKQLLAHELTHVVQQNSVGRGRQTKKQIQRAPAGGYTLRNVLTPFLSIDIHGQTQIRLGREFDDYILSYLGQGISLIPIIVSFGTMGQGKIYIRPKILGFTEQCEYYIIEPGPLPPIVIIIEECGYYFNASKSFFDADPQLIPIEMDGIDTSIKSGTLALNVEIRKNQIVSSQINADDSGKAVGWVPGRTKTTLSPFDRADFSREAFLSFIYGKDYDGKNFQGSLYTNHVSDGNLIFNSEGGLQLPNKQSIFGLIQLGDAPRMWDHMFDTNILGADDYEFPVNRTDKGELSGEGDALMFDESWTGKGFKAKAALRISFVNSNLLVEGSASYESKRAKGELMVIVTDYTTAKRFATDYLPDDIANKSKTDPPPNPADQLAFAGAGNISFTLFNGNKESRRLLPTPKDVIGDPPEPQENKALEAEASFVVEPEGFITISGQVRAPKVFELVPPPKKPYEKSKEWDFTIFTIPGPLGTRANFVFAVKLSYGASIGPLTLSEIIADGRYSSRPDTASELELSALFKLLGKVFVKLSACFKVEGSILGLFDIDVLEWCPLELELAALGAVQARPTIQVVIPAKDPDRTTPPEYYIRGAFNFDVAGDLIFTIGDSLTINLSKKEPADPDVKAKDKAVPKDWRYKRNKNTVKNRYGSRDVEIPMDHTLGSEEIPRVSLANFVKDNLEERIKKLITQDRPPREKESAKKYFGEGIESLPAKTATPDKNISEGGYEEGGEQQGGIADKAAHPRAEQPSYVFEEEFFMDGAPHKLTLVITQIDNAGAIDFDVVLMMKSELEQITEKIDEEKQDVKDHPDQLSDWKKKDIEQIQKKAQRVVSDAKKLGVNDELSNSARQPVLKELAFSIHNYGDRYKKKDLGIPDQTVKPACNEPLDAGKGMEITFTKYEGHVNKGRVIGVASYKSPKGNFAQWTIQYKPYGSREGTMVAPPAYDENCKPLYFITKPENCEDVQTDHSLWFVGERTINGERIKERTKAHWVKAWPLCWGPYQEPIGILVGQDRIKESRQGKWHRAHLIHGNMGGPGLWWNLVPVPKHINNDYMPDKYENTLKNLVRYGFGVNKRYWFEAKVLYHDDWHPVIGHHNDFAKGMEIRFGEIEQDDKGAWTKFKPALTDMTLDFGTILRDELAPNRVKG